MDCLFWARIYSSVPRIVQVQLALVWTSKGEGCKSCNPRSWLSFCHRNSQCIKSLCSCMTGLRLLRMQYCTAHCCILVASSHRQRTNIWQIPAMILLGICCAAEERLPEYHGRLPQFRRVKAPDSVSIFS